MGNRHAAIKPLKNKHMQLLSYEELKETITNKIKTRVVIYYQ